MYGHITFDRFVLTSKVHKLTSVCMENQAMIQNGIGPLCTSKHHPQATQLCTVCFFGSTKNNSFVSENSTDKKVRLKVNGNWLAERLLRQGDFAHSI